MTPSDSTVTTAEFNSNSLGTAGVPPMMSMRPSNRREAVTGLFSTMPIPAAVASSATPSRPNAVSISIWGICFSGSNLMRFAVSTPSRSGIFQSSRTMSYGALPASAACTCWIADMPPSACPVWKLMPSSMSHMTARAPGKSSTTRIRRPRRSTCGRSSRTELPTASWAVNQKVDPSPGTLSTPTSPPI